MSKYERKTEDEFHTQGLYFGRWETLTIDTSRRDAMQMLRDYNENDPKIKHRVVKKRVPKGE